MPSILALDLGSTQLKLLLLNEKAKVTYIGTQRYETYAKNDGFISQSPLEWRVALRRGMKELSEKCNVQDIEGVCFSGHMSSVVLLDKQGEVLHECIMLADTRSEEQTRQLQKNVGQIIKTHTGNPVINAFSLPKLVWLKQAMPQIWDKTYKWVCAKDYLRFCLTNKIATDYTDAYNSLCAFGNPVTWCEEIISGANLEIDKFADILAPAELAGRVTKKAAEEFFLPEGINVYAGGADMACGAVGMAMYEDGEAVLTLGTCATFLTPVPKFDNSVYGSVTFHLHAIENKYYALGSHFNGGLGVNWITAMLSDDGEINFEKMDRLCEEALKIPPGCDGVMSLPFLAGSGSPYFDSKDRQTIIGASAACTRAHLFRSQLEGITYNLAQTKYVFDTLIDNGVSRVLLGGGGANVIGWPKIIADVFGVSVDFVSNKDASAVGAAILGAVGAGIFTDVKAVSKLSQKVERTINCDDKLTQFYKGQMEKYLNLYKTMRSIYENY